MITYILFSFANQHIGIDEKLGGYTMNKWFFAAVAIAVFLLLNYRNNQRKRNNETEQVKKWENHPLRNKILNDTISLVNQELTRGLGPAIPNERYFVAIHIDPYGCTIGIERPKYEKDIPFLDRRGGITLSTAGYQDITYIQMKTLGKSLMSGLKNQYAADSEILISIHLHHSSKSHIVSTVVVRVDLTKKRKELKKIEI